MVEEAWHTESLELIDHGRIVMHACRHAGRQAGRQADEHESKVMMFRLQAHHPS